MSIEFDYSKEPRRDIFCIDCKSFYASVECAELKKDVLTTLLVVMSRAENAGGLILAASPKAKEVLGISNVTRKNEVPPHPDLLIVPPRMNLYIKKNQELNNIYKEFVTESDHHVYSVDESFLDVTQSISLFRCDSAYELAALIQSTVMERMGLQITIGIGDNPLLAKLALDNAAKNQKPYIAEWRYKDVPKTLWQIQSLTDFWGIGYRMGKRLNKLGITTIEQLAHSDYYLLKERFGIMGAQLYAHAWGIDRSFLGNIPASKEKSIGNSQILPKTYTRRQEIEIVLSELADQVAARLRKQHYLTTCVSIYVGFASGYLDSKNKRSFHQQMKITATNSSKELIQAVLYLFQQNYTGQEVRHVGISYGQLSSNQNLQLNLFSPLEDIEKNEHLDEIVDRIRKKFGYQALVHATSVLEGGTAIERAGLVGGHAGGNEGLQ